MVAENTSIEEIRKTVEDLCGFGQKAAGTKAEVQAANYLCERLKGFGFSRVEKQSFDVHGWNPVSCRVRIETPIRRELESALFPYGKSELVEGRLVSIDKETTGSSSVGKGLIALCEWGPDVYLSPRMTYFRAVKLGYAGLIVAAQDAGNMLKVVVLACGGLLKIPVVCITKEEGQFLLSMIKAGEVTVSINTEVEVTEKSKSYNVVGILDGDGTSEHEVVVGAHYDSWFQGAGDNCAPAATVLELARIFHARSKAGNLPKRTIRFLFYGAEESGTNDFYFWLNGSKYYVRDNQDSVARTAAVLSLDSTGYPEPAANYIYATGELRDFAKSLRADGGKVPSLGYVVPPTYGSDHWFFEISGVPTVYGVSHPSPLYHTTKDDPDHLNFDAVHFYAEYMKAALSHLSSCGLLPIDIFVPLEILEEILSKYTKMDGNPVDLKSIVAEVKGLMKRKSSFRKLLASATRNGRPEHLTRLNQFLLAAANGFNRTVGWSTSSLATYTVAYLSRLEMIEDYVNLTNSIKSLRAIPIASFDSDAVKRIESQSDNAYNWLRIHDSLANLEQERARIRKEIEEEIASLSKLMGTLSDGITKLIGA